jgi:hypothetical protein
MAGRPKGSISSKSLTVRALCEKYNYDPIKDLVALLNSKTPPLIRVQIASTLLPYLHPRLTATQISGDPDSPVIINIVQFKGQS